MRQRHTLRDRDKYLRYIERLRLDLKRNAQKDLIHAAFYPKFDQQMNSKNNILLVMDILKLWTPDQKKDQQRQ